MQAIKKGDRIEATTKGNVTLYGVVTAVRSGKITATLDGGKQKISGPVHLFRISSVPIKRDTVKTPADIYGVTKYKVAPIVAGRWEGHEGNGLSCRITKNGKEILEVYNEGVGGSNTIHILNTSVPVSEVDAFYAAVKAWYTTLSGEENDYGCADDFFITWYVEYRPFGVTAEEYLKR